mmetsp:Transcript_20213/g.33384  ORF Transcript_20213/g.33384 Transcript_20213/m.33384 type:complete len:802 (+) Transcript_20213:69-2474(+)
MDRFLAKAKHGLRDIATRAETVAEDFATRADQGMNNLIRRLEQPIEVPQIRMDVPQNAQEVRQRLSQVVDAAIGAPVGRESLDAAVLRGAAETGETESRFANARPLATEELDAFVVGDAVEVWSNSQQKWFPDGFVQEVAAEEIVIGDSVIPARSVFVAYSGGSKWVIPEHFSAHLKRYQSSMMGTQILAAARVLGADATDDKTDEFRSIETSCQLQGCQFRDPDFLAVTSGRVSRWCRPAEIGHHDGRPLASAGPWMPLPGLRGAAGADWQLFRGAPQADDVQQGELGNCWFISALAVLAEFQSGRFVRMLFPLQKEVSASGAYMVRFCLGGRWRDIIIDDTLPCIGGKGYYTQLAYCSTSRLQLWASLVEKAFAKVCGSYEGIEAGQTDEALTILTGWPCKRIDFNRDGFDPDILWATLSTARDAKFLMTCSTGRDESVRETVGLVPTHAYSLLDVFDVVTASGSSVRLLKVRNPHAKTKWRGDWSDTSPLWTVALRAQCNYLSGESAGVFIIAFSDFLRWFDTCAICRIRGGEWHESRIPLQIPSCSIPQVGLAIEVSETAECCVTLSQPEERIRPGPLVSPDLGALACMGFVIVCIESNPQKESKPMAVGQLRCRSAISADCWLQPGCSYLLVPLSRHFGTEVPAVCAFVSSKVVAVSERRIPFEAARAAWATFARSGDRDPFHNCVVYTSKASGGAVVTLAENRGHGHFNVELSYTSDPPDCFSFSRGTHQTNDWIAPGYGQILQIALPDGARHGSVGWHSHRSFNISMFVPRGVWHMPSVGESHADIHAPFRLSR